MNTGTNETGMEKNIFFSVDSDYYSKLLEANNIISVTRAKTNHSPNLTVIKNKPIYYK